MSNTEPAELLPRPRSLLISATLIAATTTYLALDMAEAVVKFRAMFKDLGVPSSRGADLVFSVPGIWWMFALASIAVLVWMAAKSRITPATKRRMKTAMVLTVVLTALTYGITAYAIYTPLFKLGATV